MVTLTITFSDLGTEQAADVRSEAARIAARVGARMSIASTDTVPRRDEVRSASGLVAVQDAPLTHRLDLGVTDPGAG